MALWKRCKCRDRSRDVCDHPWWSALQIDGKRFQVSLERHFKRSVRGRGSKTLAKALDSRLRLEIREGGVARSAAPAQRLSFAEFIEVYRKGYAELRGLRSWSGDRRWKLGKLARAWQGREFRSLSKSDVEAFLLSLHSDGLSPATLRRYYALTHHFFGWAERQGLIERSPLSGQPIDLPVEENERQRRLQGDEEARLLAAADTYLRDLIVVSLDTCLRRGTLLALQAKHLDAASGVLRLPAAILKGKKPLVLPMTARVRAIFVRRMYTFFGQQDAFIFGNEVGQQFASPTPLVKRWRAARGVARCIDLHWHDLRGEGASRLAEMGVSVDTIRRLLGHSTLAMTQRYLRARVGELADVVEAFEGWRPR